MRQTIGLVLLTLGTIVYVPCSVAASKSSSSASLEMEGLYSTHIIGSRFLGGVPTSSLSKGQREAIQAAKSALIDFFKSTQKIDKSLVPFLGAQLSAKYPNRPSLMDALLGQDVSVESVTVVGFDVGREQEIALRYYLVIFSEGNYLLREDTAIFAKEKAAWKIVGIGGLK